MNMQRTYCSYKESFYALCSLVGGSTPAAHSQHVHRGRILGRNLDKSFPPCYSQSPLQLCLEISISSNSRNLLQFLQFSAKEKEENPVLEFLNNLWGLGIALSNQTTRLHNLAELVPWNPFLGSLKV